MLQNTFIPFFEVCRLRNFRRTAFWKKAVIPPLSVSLLLCLALNTFSISRPRPQGVFPSAINEHGAVVGHYVGPSGYSHGFVRTRNGKLVTFDVPGAANTLPASINGPGAITGYYTVASPVKRGCGNTVKRGFLRDHGAFTTFDAPGAGIGIAKCPMGHPEACVYRGTVPTSINDDGVITGYFIDANNLEHGFVRDRYGAFITFDPQAVDAGEDAAVVEYPGPFIDQGTVPNGINNGGMVVGDYFGHPNATRSSASGPAAAHGFVRDNQGVFTIFDAPDAGPRARQGTHALCINTDGAITGYYSDAKYVVHGFVRDRNGTVTTFDAPNASTGHGTYALGINDDGTIMGYYYDAQNTVRVFVRRKNGTITSFDAPNGGTSPWPTGINKHGTITGYYGTTASFTGRSNWGLSSKNVIHGFVRDRNGGFTKLTMTDWSQVKREHIEKACRLFDAGKEVPIHPTQNTSMVWHQRSYPAKFILGVAYRLATGHTLDPRTDYSDEQESVTILRSMGFEVRVGKPRSLSVTPPTGTSSVPLAALRRNAYQAGAQRHDD